MAQGIIAALVIAGWLTVYISSRRSSARACADLRMELQRQIDSLSESVRSLERTIAAKVSEEISPETLAAITETIKGLLGRNVRIRSVKRLHAPSGGFS